MVVLNLLFFIIACAILVVSGRWLVKSLIKIAQFLKITEYVAAFIIMAIATSIPELFVGISSALSKNTALVLGNVIGANIIDITLIIGIFTLIGKGIKVETKGTKNDVFYMILIVMLPIVLFLIGGSISRIDGIILVAIFCIYSYRLIKRSRKFEKVYKGERKIKRHEIILNVLLFIASLVILFGSASFIIKYATALSSDLALPPIMIGLFLISIGTTLPELTFGMRAVLARHKEMAISNQIGTIIVNSTLVLGISAIIYPISAAFYLFAMSAAFLLLACFIFATFIKSGRKIDVTEGISLILLYIFFVILEFYIKGAMN